MMSEVIQMPRQDGHTFKVGDGLMCDLSTLVDTRLLVQANSGGGKSWCLRRILEQTHGKVQHLVIDPEGEFASLRERFDYVYAARQGGDTAADPRSAKLLAERLLELGVSAVLDIYELKAHERIRFVRFFLEALVDAPKALWHPAIVVLDEAHVYCPQKGEAESAGAVIDMATRGRKRGFCLVPATQRLSKLHKDAAAECNNKLIGRTALDVDVDRAADELGLTTKDQKNQLRDLRAGEFYAYGPAFTAPTIAGSRIARVVVGAIQTTHPKAGARIAFTAPPPTAKVRAMLPQLADLPAEVEARERSVEDLKREVATLKRELTMAQKGAPAPTPAKDVQVLTDADRQSITNLQRYLEQMAGKLGVFEEETLGKLEERVAKATAHLIVDAKAEIEHRRAEFLAVVARAGYQKAFNKIAAAPTPPPATPSTVAGSRSTPRVSRPASKVVSDGELSGPEQRIVDAIAWLNSIGNGEPEQTAVAFLACYTYGAGAFNNPRGSLRQKGFVEYLAGNRIRLTDEGAALANVPEETLTSDELHARILDRLPGPEQRLLKPLLSAYPRAMTSEELAAAAGYTAGAGAFNNPKGRLRTLGLVEYPAPGKVVAREVLFP